MGKPLPAKSMPLEGILNESEDIKDSVDEAASDLSSINDAIKASDVIDPQGTVTIPAQTFKQALAENEEAEHKVAKAAADLGRVNAALSKEVAERRAIESQLADMRTDLAEARDDLSTSQAKEEEARQSANRDAVTGLPNRVLFDQRLDHALIQARRHGWGVAVMFIDIDNFKDINDSYGHDLGDRVLLVVANRLQASVRGEDMVSRWGGDEFVCLLLDVKREADMALLAARMAGRIGDACEFDGIALSITASIGVAIWPGDGETADILLKHADRAMYVAKRTEKKVMLFRECPLD
ncbi:MAG TPA: diguanylate cyclase [Candidatus Binatia bacterium]|nr:diguanylate cyclase [Candidatus Binatia bacterium]